MDKFVDRLFTLYPNKGFTKTQLRRLIDQGYARLNGKIHRIATTSCSSRDRVELLEVPLETKKPDPMRVVYEDTHVRIYDKPVGVESDVRRYPLLIHRLDKETSGLLMEAKSDKALLAFQELFRNKKIQKNYYAIVGGRFANGVTVELPIGRVGRREGFERFGVTEQGKMGITYFAPVQHTAHYTLLDCSPKTGRTHQIRVHLAALDHPIIGDLLYSKSTRRFEQMYLFAYGLDFQHPFTQEPIYIRLELPSTFSTFLANDSKRDR